MAINIENIFKATAGSTKDFLIASGQACYIPAYQRPYSWDRNNVERLFEDAVHGMNMLFSRKDTITFLGTIIAIHDTKHRTIQPIFKSEVASKVMTIIDGQQRICTFLMINMAFHDQIRRLSGKFAKKKEDPFVWIFDQAQRLLPELEETFVLDMRTGQGNYQFYPRIIRAYADVWSRKKVQAKYTSPLARLIWEYFEYTKGDEKKAFRYEPKDKEGTTIPHYQSVAEIFKYIQRRASQITDKNAGSSDFPEVLQIIQSADFVDAIWGFEIPEEVKAYLTDEAEDKLYEAFAQLVRLIVVAQYMSRRMAFTVVTTESEDDAFDMFEALNTTGEPLTAYETFKPKVIDAESLEKYEISPSIKWINRIEEYLERFRKAEQKQSATSEMLVPFALAETGEKLQKRLNDQRRYLRDQYEDMVNPKEKREFVRRLSDIAYFMQFAWDTEGNKAPSFYPLGVDVEDMLVGFEALRDINHHITIAPLSRFYGLALESDGQERTKRTATVVQAVKATVAFSMLWRAAHGTTQNIDNHYRDIMRVGIAVVKTPPMARRSKSGAGAVSISNYKKALRHYLQSTGGFKTKADWVKAAARIPIYGHQKVVARFMLFCASDDSVPDNATPGLIKKGRTDVAPMMNLNRWHDLDYFTVEHIAPENPAGGWVADIHEDPDTVHRLGNLLLLPQEENSVLGNRSWDHKRVMYELLSSADEESFNAAKGKCGKIGLTLSKQAEDVLEISSYLGMCKSVAAKPDDWDRAFIDVRSKRIAELAWDRLSPWLDLS